MALRKWIVPTFRDACTRRGLNFLVRRRSAGETLAAIQNTPK
jgi:hypothetical protein